MRVKGDAVLERLQAAGLTLYLRKTQLEDYAVRGQLSLRAVIQLRNDMRWHEGDLYQLHRDVGEHLTEFRSYRGEVGSGSVQIVIDLTTGAFYADCDRFSPYNDVVNFVGHAFGEVIPSWFRRRPRDGDAV